MAFMAKFTMKQNAGKVFPEVYLKNDGNIRQGLLSNFTLLTLFICLINRSL